MSNALTVINLHVPNVKVNGPSLDIGEMDKQGFEILGRKLKTLKGAAQFWIGDWANELIKQHGQGAMTELAELLGYESKTVQTYAQIANKYDAPSRLGVLEARPELTHGHFHEALQAPSPLYELENLPEGMSTKELRAQIKAEKEARVAATQPASKKVAFSWIRDPRVEAAEKGFAAIRTVVQAMKKSNEDKAIRDIILGNFESAVDALGDEF